MEAKRFSGKQRGGGRGDVATEVCDLVASAQIM